MAMMMVDELVDCFRKTFDNNEENFFHLLISNSTRALDRHESESSTVPPYRYINVDPDKTNNTLTISDNGVGMTHAEVLNLATIATSGAKVFMEAVAAGSDLNPIWKFGLGFYFAFLVADKVVFRTKHYNDEEYALDVDLDYQDCRSPTVTSGSLGLYRPSGSKMTLYLKEDQLEYLEAPRLRDLIKKHPIRHEIGLGISVTSQVELPAFPPNPDKKKTTITVETHALEIFCQGTSLNGDSIAFFTEPGQPGFW